MKSLDTSGRTVEEAIQNALEQLGVSREKVRVSVLKEGKHGILGLGTEEPVVRVELLESETTKMDDISEEAKTFLETLLSKLGVVAEVESQVGPPVEDEEGAAGTIRLDIKGEDLGILIGRRGQTLACLQYLVRLMVAHRQKEWVSIVIDVEGYKQRRSEALQALALRLAEQVKARKTPFTLEPMPAFERRIVHLALADHTDVTTQSVGIGEARRVVILLKEK
jgi:spoIIIJ-associated protein